MAPLPFSPEYHRRRMQTLAASFGLSVALFAGLNAWLDPYYRIQSHAPQVAPPERGLDLALFHMVEFQRLPRSKIEEAEVVVIGDSRARPLTDRSCLYEVHGRPVLNLAFPSASLEEALVPFVDRLPQLRRAHIVISVLSPEWLCKPPLPNRCEQSRTVSRWLLPYLLSRDVLGKSLTLLPGHSEPAPPTLAEESVENHWARLRKNYRPELAQRRLTLLRETLQPLPQRGMDVLFWAPPLRPDLGQKMIDEGLLPWWHEMVAQAETIAPVWDMTFEREVSGTTLTFRDPMHHENGPLILEALVARAGQPEKAASDKAKGSPSAGAPP